MKEELFDYAGTDYKICIWKDEDETIKVKVFKLNGKPANGYTYTVKLTTATDLKAVVNLDAVKVLADHAKRDIMNGAWERYLKDIEFMKLNPLKL